MASKLFVTEAQVKAARILVERDRALGREPDAATRKIAEARPAQPADRQPENQSGSRPGAVRFWEALDPAERDALRAAGSWRTFAPGDKLMTEGEQADHIAVILGGRTKVSVRENGRERVLAVRGVGQLVGERAVLPVRASVRSATVTALELVWALVVSSDDFAAFTRAHPRVLAMVNDQLFDRLTEDLTTAGRYGADRGPSVSSAGPSGDLPAGRSPHRLEMLNGENCTVLLTDVIGPGDDTRTDDERRLIRETLSGIIAEALQGIPDAWTLDRGGALLTIFPPSISTAEIMSRLRKDLPSAIERHNRSERGPHRFQIRIAINVGPVFADAAAAVGEAITVAARLLEAPRFEAAIADSRASLGIVISPFVYETFIRPGPDMGEVASYTHVPVDIRGASTEAWMQVIPRT